MSQTIVVAVDGSPESGRAVQWCADHAAGFEGKVVVVHAIEVPVYPTYGNFGPAMLPPAMTDAQREELRNEIAKDWCSALGTANVPFDVVLLDGGAATVVREVADDRDADLVVVGRRGRGGFAELVLGSTSHQLAHHLGRTLVIVP